MQEPIRAENLCKQYGVVPALDQVSLSAHEGECLGIFGISGAGKSVLLRLIAGAESPDSGAISPIHERIGFSRQTVFLSGNLTPGEALWLYATLYEIPRGKRRTVIRDVLALVGLESERNRRIRTLSDGARKLLEVARALMSPSDLLLLDEPMAGLDSDVRRRLWEHLLRIRAYDRKTIIIATSRSEDAELCDTVILLHKGRILAAGSPAELRDSVGPEALVIRPSDSRGSRSSRGWSGIVESDEDDSVVIEVDPRSPPAELLRRIPCEVAAIRIARRSLDSVLDELAEKVKE